VGTTITAVIVEAVLWKLLLSQGHLGRCAFDNFGAVGLA